MIARVFGPSGGSGGLFMESVDLSDQIDSSTQIFTLSPFRRGSLLVFYNGIAQRNGVEIIEQSNSQFRTDFIPTTGSTLLVFYQPL